MEKTDPVKSPDRQGISLGKMGFYSNNNMDERLKPLTDLGVKIYVGEYPKPMAEGFLDACEEFEFDPATTWMAGDNPATDGGAVGVLEGMVLVKPIEQNNEVLSTKKRAKLVVQKLLRALAMFFTTVGNKKLLTSEDLKRG